MALTAEERKIFDDVMQNVRFWYGKGLGQTANERVLFAVADHLTAVEGLLKRIDDHLKVNGYSQGAPWRADVVVLRSEIATLLGGTANDTHK